MILKDLSFLSLAPGVYTNIDSFDFGTLRTMGKFLVFVCNLVPLLPIHLMSKDRSSMDSRLIHVPLLLVGFVADVFLVGPSYFLLWN